MISLKSIAAITALLTLMACASTEDAMPMADDSMESMSDSMSGDDKKMESGY